MFEVESNVNRTAFQGQRRGNLFLDRVNDLLAILSAFFLSRHRLLERGAWWRLVLLFSHVEATRFEATASVE